MHDQQTEVVRFGHLMIVAPDKRILIQKSNNLYHDSYSWPNKWRATLGTKIRPTATAKTELLHLLYIKFDIKYIELKESKTLFVGTHYITKYTTLEVYLLILNEMVKLHPSIRSDLELISYERLFREATKVENFNKLYTSDTTVACNVINTTLGEIPCSQQSQNC